MSRKLAAVLPLSTESGTHGEGLVDTLCIIGSMN